MISGCFRLTGTREKKLDEAVASKYPCDMNPIAKTAALPADQTVHSGKLGAFPQTRWSMVLRAEGYG